MRCDDRARPRIQPLPSVEQSMASNSETSDIALNKLEKLIAEIYRRAVSVLTECPQMFNALEFSTRNLTKCLGFRLDSDDEFISRTRNIGTACFF